MTSVKQGRQENGPPGPGIIIPWRWIGLGLLFLIVTTAGYLIWNHLRGTRVERGTRALVQAFRDRRLIEPRLTGGFKAAVYSTNPEERSGIDDESLEDARSLLTDAHLQDEVGAKAAYARLLLAQNTLLPEAQKHLRDTTASDPKDSRAHNDLGVCLMLRGRIEDAMQEFTVALELDPKMPEAQFNHSLCLQNLHLRRPAAEGFAKLLEYETDRSWADETRSRHEAVAALIQPPPSEEQNKAELEVALRENDEEKIGLIVRRGYDHFARYGYDVMRRHLEAFLAGNSELAEEHLKVVERMGGIAQKLKNDSAITSAAEYLRGMPDEDKGVELELLVKFQSASKLLLHRKEPARTLELFKSLIGPYEERGNYLLLQRSIFGVGFQQLVLGQLTEAMENFNRSLQITEENGWIHDESRRIMNIGLCHSSLGYDSKAIDIYEQCLDLFSRINENSSKIHQYLGVAYWHIGRLETSLDHFRQSTAILLQDYGRMEELAYNYLNVADIYRLAARYDLALSNGEQAVELSRISKDSSRLAQALSFVAVERARKGLLDQAKGEIEEAMALVNEMETGQGHTTVPLVLTRAGNVASFRGETERAIDLFSQAKEKAEGQGKFILRVNALRELADVYIKDGRADLARPILTSAIDDIEYGRRILGNPSDQIDYLSARQGIYDQLIDLYAAEPSLYKQALKTSEQSRARALYDRIKVLKADGDKVPGDIQWQDESTAESMLGELQRNLPANTTVLLYTVTLERTLIFAISPSTFDVFHSDAGSAKIEQLVSKFVTGIVDKTQVEELSETGKALYKLLISPVESKIGLSGNLCIIPDKALNFLPFSALMNDSERYLMESHRVTVAPSARVLIHSIGRVVKREPGVHESFLGVGNPTLSGEWARALSELPEAAREAKITAKFYMNPEILVESDATERNVLNGLKRCNVAHLALHCLVKPESSLLASLMLAPMEATSADSASSLPSEDDGVLSLNEVYGLSLPNTHMVVLSACQSGLGQYYRGEGIVSLIHPLLSAGVSTVVASLWPVESSPTFELMSEFHKARTERMMSSGDALREAQLHMLRSGYDHPYYWASFIVVGGNY